MEHIEPLLLERKAATQRHFGGDKQWSGFVNSEGLCMVLHCSHRMIASKDNDSCSEGLIPATAMHMSDKEMKDIYSRTNDNKYDVVVTSDGSLFPGNKEVSQTFRGEQGKTVP